MNHKTIIEGLTENASTDTDRVVINSIRIENGKAISTNGGSLLCMPYEGSHKNGTWPTAKIMKRLKPEQVSADGQLALDYPNWRQVIPDGSRNTKFTISPGVEALIVGLPKPKDTARTEAAFSISVSPNEKLHLSARFSQLVRAIRKCGVTGPLVIEIITERDPIFVTAESCPEMLAINMPSRHQEETPEIK